MKRALGLLITIIACVIAFLAVRGTMPFLPVFGISMEPTLHAGNLILIEKLPPEEIEIDDIIVFNVPSMIRDYYNYPPVIAHRVLEVNETPYGVHFRTHGDNTGEDPFATSHADVRGKVGKQIPYLGFPLLFFQSQQGLIFVIIGLFLLAFYLYMDDLALGRRKMQEGIFAPVIRENRRQGRVLEQRTERVESGMESTHTALSQFAGAIAEYAEHLKSHTSAIQGLAEASHELKSGAVDQNQVLTRLMEVIEQGIPVREQAPARPKVAICQEETHPVHTPPTPKAPKPKSFPPGCIKNLKLDGNEENNTIAG
ncbi:signal peptidase I [Chloroflexota bacterium]